MVAATDVGAVSEVVVDERTGLLVEPLSPEAFASAAASLLRDPAKRRRLGVSGREHVIANYDVEICADRYVAAFGAAMEYQAARRQRR